ncbi:MAG: hypothetical protein JZU70_09625 [Chlorobium sp.]|jgi:hypothetical protein|nr:hypothetical protein [Chlorobium sp.]
MEATHFTKPAKAFYSTDELVAFLFDFAGMTVTKGTVFKWSMAGKIPCQKAPNGRLLFPVHAIQDWIQGDAEKVEA